MQRLALPAGIDPCAVRGSDGLTYLSYQDLARGFVIERFADPQSRELVFQWNSPEDPPQGCGRLSAQTSLVGGAIFAAFRANGQVFEVMGITRPDEPPPTPSRGPCLGNQPLAYAPDGTLCIQRPPNLQVETEGGVGLEIGAPTGLARVTQDGGAYTVVTWDDDFYGNHLDTACVLATGDRVSQGPEGGILCSLGGKVGTLLPGEACYQPWLVPNPSDGTYMVVFGTRNSQGAGPQQILIGVTAADFAVAPPAPRPQVQPLAQPAILLAILHPNAKSVVPDWCNAWIDEAKGGGTLHGRDGQQWHVVDLEAGGLYDPALSPAFVMGTAANFANFRAANQYDICAPQVYRDPNETNDAYRARLLGTVSAVSARVPRSLVVPLINDTDRAGTVAVVDIEDGLAVASQVAEKGAGVFENGRPGEIPNAGKILTQWRNGQPCPPQALPPPVPQPKPPEPVMPYKTFSRPGKDAPDYIAYMNDVGQRVGPYLGLPTDNPAPDTHFTSAGQAVNECYDLWDAAQQALGNGGATIPSANIMSQIAIDRKLKNLSADAVSASLKHEVPLR